MAKSKQKQKQKQKAKPTEGKKVLIVDDHPVVRRGLSDLIDGEPGLEVCGQVSGPGGALKAMAEHLPDVAVVDISLGDASGLELIKQLKAQDPKLRVLVVSMHDEDLYAERALRAGAHGYIMKSEPPESILQALRCVADGKPYVSEAMSSRLIAQLAGVEKTEDTSPASVLSDRELEVFELLGRGLATAQIADALSLSVKTVQTHRENLKRKLGVHISTELIQQAVLWWQEQAGAH